MAARNRRQPSKPRTRRSPKTAAPPPPYLLDAQPWRTAQPAPLWLRIVLPLLIAVAAFVTYFPALDAGFVDWDDDKVIVDNPRIRGLTDDNLAWAFHASKMGHYHPLTWLSYALDHAIGAARYNTLPPDAQTRYDRGLDPRVFHLTNLLLHAATAVAFYFLARLLLKLVLPPPAGQRSGAAEGAATIAALLFACHPLRVENAVWVTERRDVLSALFLIPCLHCYLRYVLVDRWNARKLAWYAAATVLLFLSLMSKAWGITLPAVMLLLDYHPLQRLGRKAGWLSPRALVAYVDKLPFLILAGVFAKFARDAQADQVGTMKTLAEWSLLDRTLQAFYGLFFYAYKTLVPTGLTPLVQLPPVSPSNLTETTPEAARIIAHQFVLASLLAAVVVIATAVVLFLLRKRWPAGIICGLIYAGVVSPVLGFAQSGPQLVADKYAYLACLPWAVLAGGGLLWLWRHRHDRSWARRIAPVAGLVALLLIPTYAVLAYRQSKIWQSSHALWTHAVRADPQCVLARTNLGMLERQANHLDAAIAHYQAALAIDPDDAILLNNYAVALQQRPGGLDKAIDVLQQAVDVMPDHPDLHYSLGSALRKAGRLDDAIAEFHTCVRLRDEQPTPRYHRALGEIYRQQRRLNAARQEYERALQLERRLNPRGLGVINALDRLGRIAAAQGHTDEAIAYFERLLEVEPDNGPAQRMLAALRAQAR